LTSSPAALVQRAKLMQGMKQIELTHQTRSVPFAYREGTSDEPLFQQIFIEEEYSLKRLRVNPEIDALLEQKSAQGLRPLILDLGGNIGAAAVYFSLIYPNSRVVAVEPDPDNFEVLSRNTQGLDCVAVAGAVASEKGFVKVCDPGLGPWGMRTEFDARGRIEAFTVPELLHRYGGEQFFPFIVKIDIEGAEAELFSKNIDWIDAIPVMIIELHDWLLPGACSSRNFLKAIAGLDRDFVYIGENVFSIRTPIANHEPSYSVTSQTTGVVASG